MIRNFADMLWSTYNFWCTARYDGVATCNDYSRWVNPLVHKRSPEKFHEIVLGDYNGTKVRNPFLRPLHRPCYIASHYYSYYLDTNIYSKDLSNITVVIASEEFAKRPLQILQKIATYVNISIPSHVKPFLAPLVNTQDAKGEKNVTDYRKYIPGRYQVSNYQPMLPETVSLLNRCWKSDCRKIYKATGYAYSACSVAAESYVNRSRGVLLNVL